MFSLMEEPKECFFFLQAEFGGLELLLHNLLSQDPNVFVGDLLISAISEKKDEKHSTSGYSRGWGLVHSFGLWAQCHSDCGEHKLNRLPHA